MDGYFEQIEFLFLDYLKKKDFSHLDWAVKCYYWRASFFFRLHVSLVFLSIGSPASSACSTLKRGLASFLNSTWIFLFQGVLAGTSKCFYAFIGNFYKRLYLDLLTNSNNPFYFRKDSMPSLQLVYLNFESNYSTLVHNKCLFVLKNRRRS